MKTFLLMMLLLVSPRFALALSLDNSILMLGCPGRGSVEVILHRYEHTQETWGQGQFETGGGYMKKGGLVVFPFANLDRLIYDQITASFGFWYAREARLVRCQLLSLRNTYPTDIPYFRE